MIRSISRENASGNKILTDPMARKKENVAALLSMY
jgi:hypothetical protein